MIAEAHRISMGLLVFRFSWNRGQVTHGPRKRNASPNP
ncbi:hypothetical protein SAMN05444166_4418 [Singulisphaera sp. GP187]|nr:hypothetical protein SAMN05444166_4418 [Singulisphaera sp. GP187]